MATIWRLNGYYMATKLLLNGYMPTIWLLITKKNNFRYNGGFHELLCKKSIDEGNIYNQADEEQFLGLKKHWFACLMIATIIFSCGFNILHVKNFNLFFIINKGIILLYIFLFSC